MAVAWELIVSDFLPNLLLAQKARGRRGPVQQMAYAIPLVEVNCLYDLVMAAARVVREQIQHFMHNVVLSRHQLGAHGQSGAVVW